MNNHVRSSHFNRRRMLRGASLAAAGTVGAIVIGCGDDDDDAGPTGTSAAGATATTAASPADEPVRGGRLRTASGVTLGIDPHMLATAAFTKIYNGLGAQNRQDQTFDLHLAESLEQPGDTEFIFKLRPGVRFHNLEPANGREVTAEDVVYSLERLRDHPKASGNTFFKQFVSTMEATDDHTFRLTTNEPFAEALTEMLAASRAIVAREAVERFGDLETHGIGTGPFILREYSKGERALLTRNPDYWDAGLPYLDEYEETTILDANTLLQAYKSDRIDINAAPLTKLDAQELERDRNRTVIRQANLSYNTLAVNASAPPYRDPRVREALYHGINRQVFINTIGLGEGTPQGVLNNGLEYWVLSQDELKQYLEYDLGRAKQLLSAAGYEDGWDMVLYTGGTPTYTSYAEVLVPELEKLNIRVDLQVLEIGAYITSVLREGAFDATTFGHGVYDTPRTALRHYHSLGIGGKPRYGYNNPAVDRIVEAQDAELDPEARRELIHEAQHTILADYGPMINFISQIQYASFHNRVGGYNPQLRAYQLQRFSEFIRPGA